ncbi:MAG: hypothetical protein EAZ90_17255 [Oscillatoriales cyanobacterium]|nr:MAG: hypothetical protein EAZ90_17255 [Oscillatoriales cyanobacterium]
MRSPACNGIEFERTDLGCDRTIAIKKTRIPNDREHLIFVKSIFSLSASVPARVLYNTRAGTLAL